MVKLSIRHATTYRYRSPVALGEHRIMLRPRESCELKLLAMELVVEPHAIVTWAHDAVGNTVATATFGSITDSVVIRGNVELELDTAAWPIFNIAASAIFFPFRYSDDEALDLGALAVPQYPDPSGRFRTWVRSFVHSQPTDTLALLTDINNGVRARASYQMRDAEGTQSPTETLERTWGSCRDFAILFIEAVRTLGFGARVVSGYLYDPDGQRMGSSGAGSTHAWAEVYVAGAGWIAFDPTNRSVGGANLIPVAVGRDIRQVMPVTGSFEGMGSGANMAVHVSVVAA